MPLLLFLACPSPEKHSEPTESVAPDSQNDSPPDTDCTAIEGYTDADGDGFGDPLLPHTGCVDDPLTVDNDQDCDDHNANIHPMKAEYCDGVDQNCNGQIDENAEDAQTYYGDTDGDGHGDPAQRTVACSPPAGSVDVADDCDDSEPLAWTGAVEICGDGVDQDCDPALQPCLLSGGLYLRDAAVRIEGDGTVDTNSPKVAALGDWDGDGVGDLLVGLPYVNGTGAVYVAPMTTGTIGAQPAWSGTATSGALGWVVVALPDLDGDGRPELAAGAPGAWDYGEIQIYHSNHGNLSPREVWTGQRANGNFGFGMAELGDPDGNGIPTLAVGAMYEGDHGNGAVLLAEADAVDKSYADLQAMLGPDTAKAGFALANVGDVDGDGQEDLLVGSDSYPYTSGRTVAWLVTAPIAGNLDDVAQATWTAEALEDSAGTVVGGAGDVDGDGHMDLLIGAPESDRGGNYGGVAYLLIANPSGTTNLAASDAVIVGSWPNTMYAGVSIAAIPDIDGDTQTDIAVGAYSASDNGRTSGTVYLLSGTVRGTVTAHTSAHTWLMGESTNYAGRGVGQAGDWDGDGVSELWVSSSNYNQGRGAIWAPSLAGPP